MECFLFLVLQACSLTCLERTINETCKCLQRQVKNKQGSLCSFVNMDESK